MPAAAPPGVGGSQRGYRPPVFRQPAPARRSVPPTPHSLLGNVGRSISNVGRSVQQATHAAAPHRAPAGHPGSDIQSSGSGYGSAQANAYKRTAGYRQAIAQVFLHQPAAQKAAVIKGLLHQPMSIEKRAIGDAYNSLSYGEKAPVESLLKNVSGAMGTDLGAAALHGLSSVLKSGAGNFGGGKTSSGSGTLGAPLAFGAGTLGQKMSVNALKDAVNLPAESFSTVGTLGGDIAHGQFSKLVSDVGTPFVNLAKHPVSSIINHPLDTYLMAAAPLHGATRLAGGAIRTVAPDSAAAAAVGPSIPESVRLTGNLTHERPAFSQYPLIKGGQKLVEHARYKRKAGVLVPRSEDLRQKLLKKEVSRSLVGVRERIRRAGVEQQNHAHAKSALMPAAHRAAHAAKNTLKYNPGSALIHGADVLSRVTDHTIRTQSTFFADLEKHLQSVSATRSDLLGMPKALADHDKYVAELKATLGDKALRKPGNLERLFAAAHTYAKDTKPLQAEAHAHDHYGDMTPEALLRRDLQPVVLSHMPGARLSPTEGMVRDVPIPGAAAELKRLQGREATIAATLRRPGTEGERLAAKRAIATVQKRIGQLKLTRSEPLSTADMVAFDRAQTGGRPLAYTSHRAPRGDSAFYQSQQRYPARQIKTNTGYAFTHGLTDPTHEALLQHRVELENAINAHRSMDKILSSTVHGHPNGGMWKTHADALADRPDDRYMPIQVGRMVEKSNGPPTSDNLSHEAEIRSLNLNERLRDPGTPGKFGLIDRTVVEQLKSHENQISPNTAFRLARASTGLFRRVALGTSVRHIPGVAQEGLIRDIGAGLFVNHLISGKRVFSELEKIDPRLANERRIEIAGGTVSGMTRALATRQGSRYFTGTALAKPMRAFEAFMKAPGARQLGTAWAGWSHLVIDSTKKVLEQNQQTAAVGKAFHRSTRTMLLLQGKAAQEAARGLVSDATARQLRAEVEKVHGAWTDLTPSGQTAMMFSPFGMWWVNSVKWLARLPADQPLKLGALASATVGTEKQRQAEGLDMFSPNHLAEYLQGSIPSGNRLFAPQYYSPPGVANDPLGTLASLVEPTLMPAVLALLGDNWLGRSLTSPGDPHGNKPVSDFTKALVFVNSVLGNFTPFYTKAQTVAQGGASSYDTSTLFAPQTKTPNPGVAQGLLKTIQPLRSFPRPTQSGGASTGGWKVVSGGAPTGATAPGQGSWKIVNIGR